MELWMSGPAVSPCVGMRPNMGELRRGLVDRFSMGMWPRKIWSLLLSISGHAGTTIDAIVSPSRRLGLQSVLRCLASLGADLAVPLVFLPSPWLGGGTLHRPIPRIQWVPGRRRLAVVVVYKGSGRCCR